jgi:hypothetical protein
MDGWRGVRLATDAERDRQDSTSSAVGTRFSNSGLPHRSHSSRLDEPESAPHETPTALRTAEGGELFGDWLAEQGVGP